MGFSNSVERKRSHNASGDAFTDGDPLGPGFHLAFNIKDLGPRPHPEAKAPLCAGTIEDLPSLGHGQRLDGAFGKVQRLH